MKLLSLLLAFCVLVSFCSCGNDVSKKGMEILYKQTQDETALAYLTLLAYDNQDSENMVHYGKSFFFGSEEQLSRNYAALQTALEKSYSFDDIENSTKQVHDTMMIYYMGCSLKKNFLTKEYTYYDYIPEFFECKDKLKQSYSAVLVQFLELVSLVEFEESNLENLYEFMHISLPYLESEDVFSVLSFLQNISIQKNNEKQRDKYILIKNNINGGLGYDKDIALDLYSNPSNEDVVNNGLHIEKLIEYLDKLTMPVTLNEIVTLFKKTPTYVAQNGVLFYQINNYKVVFYGIPSIVVEIIDMDNGKIVYEKY